MATYSKGFERDENRMMNKGLIHSAVALLLTWVPVVSLILAVSGFMRTVVRVTEEHRVKKLVSIILTAVVLVAVIGAHVAAVYFYVTDPGIVNRLTAQAWKALTGQDQVPWQPAEIPPPEDNFGDYGADPYEDGGSADPNEDGGSTDPAFDDDFDDSELGGFDEDLSGEDDPAAPSDEGTATPPPSDDAADPAQKDLFNQMIIEKKAGSATYAVG